MILRVRLMQTQGEDANVSHTWVPRRADVDRKGGGAGSGECSPEAATGLARHCFVPIRRGWTAGASSAHSHRTGCEDIAGEDVTAGT
jgi:hypothetical protein